ncbi:MAG: hypothetical protein AAFZ18_06975 [Myxococcota bacterium]
MCGRIPVLGLALIAATSGCGGSASVAPTASPRPVLRPASEAYPLPERTPPPACVAGRLVTPDRVCGLGVAGRAYRWNDPKMRELARHRAARSLAGMLRSVVSSALIIGQSETNYWSKQERYLEIDESLVDRIEGEAEVEHWFDVEGEGPFRAPQRTYACACLDTPAAGIRIDPAQVTRSDWTRQYAVDEVPSWIRDPSLLNRNLHCAVGYHPRTFHPEEMLEPLTDSVRVQLMKTAETWVLSEFSEETLCKDRSLSACRSRVASLVEAANEGVSRGVALTAVWLDPDGLGPEKKKRSSYGWGCVFDQTVLDAARRRLRELRQGTRTEAPTVWRDSRAR